MNISIEQLLGKIERELKEARNSLTKARLRERVQAMKSLCELILEEPAEEKDVSSSIRTYIAPVLQPVQTASAQQPKRMEIDESANGESLFDF